MAGPERTDQQDVVHLSDQERQVLGVLESAGRPMDTIAVASATSLDVDEAHKILRRLADLAIIQEQPPEPVRERFGVDEGALQRVG